MKKYFSLLMTVVLVLSINRPALASYPNDSNWHVYHAYSSDLVDDLYLNTNGTGYYARITSISGTDPYNAVIVSCPDNGVSGVPISVVGTDAYLETQPPYSSYVKVVVSLQYTNSSYTSSNSGNVRRK